MPNDNSVSHWIDQVKLGNSIAAQQLWHHYYERLVRMARQRLRGSDVAVSDEEDVVVSVFESFYRAAENGRFPDLASRDDLWRLLLRMAARKIVDKHRHSKRVKRGGENNVYSLLASGKDNEAMIQVIGDEPSPEMVLMMTESCEQLLARLEDDKLRKIAVGKMEGYSNAELAERSGCSERTIERRLNLIREICQQELLGHDE